MSLIGYLLHSHGIKSSGFLGLFVVWMKASERHVIGKNFHFGYQFGQKFLYALSWFINKWHSQKSLPDGQKRVVNTWCWHWPQLFTLPSLPMTQIKLILQQSCLKSVRKWKEKSVLKVWNNLKRLLISIRDFKSTPASTKNAWCVTERPLPISNGQSKLKQGLKDFPMFWRKISLIEFSKR